MTKRPAAFLSTAAATLLDLRRRLVLAFLLLAPAGLWLALPALFTTGCTTIRLRPVPPDKPEKDPPPAAPSRHSLRVSQFFFQADFELKPDLPLFRDLEDLRDRIHKDLQLPSTSTVVYVYLFRDQERYQRFMGSKYPDLPDRRAFFVAQPRSVGGADELLVYTWWSERVQQDLRHELTHALLHSVLKDVPLWLDEGIAEYYEQPAEWKGVNYRHVEHLCRDPSIPDLPRLERLTGVEQMKPAEYRESWAWVHWMMHGNPKAREVLLGYLQQLRTNPSPGPLSARLGAEVPDMGGQLQKHLEKLGNRPPRGRTAQK